MTTSSRLLQPLRVGNVDLQHRMVMAPLTRFKADDKHVPLPFVKEYYAQRASVPGTLLVTEATFIHPHAGGYANVPGIWSEAQVTAWSEVTKAVHEKGSFIFMQLWALGRVADPKVAQVEGFDVIGASAIPAAEDQPAPREMTKAEIRSFVEHYTRAARNAIAAGFDGVEIHGANGYLVDQFIQDNTNQRSDEYGGSIANRSRFGLEVARAVVDAVGADRVGMRLSPWSEFQGMRMADPIPQFTHLIHGLKEIDLAYLHVVESRVNGGFDANSTYKLDFAIEAWTETRPMLIAGGFEPDTAKKCVDSEYPSRNIAIVFGRYFLSTPDLPFRIRNGLELERYHRETFYTPLQPEGYIDYPFSAEFLAAKAA